MDNLLQKKNEALKDFDPDYALDGDDAGDEGNGDNPQGSDGGDDEAAKQLRHSQQMEGAKKEVDKYKNLSLQMAVEAVSVDWQKLLEIHEKDPKFADEVAKHFKYSSFDEAKKFINPWEKIVEKDNLEDEDTRFQKRYTQMRTQEKHDEALAKANAIIAKLPAEIQEAAKAHFDEISKGHMLDDQKATTFAQMATLFVSRDKLLTDKVEKELEYFSSTGMKTGAKPAAEPEEPQPVIVNGKLIYPSSKK